LGSIRGGTDANEATKDSVEEDIEFGVFLDVLNAVTASADHSIELILRGLNGVRRGAGLLDGEGKVGVNDDAVNITSFSGSRENFGEDLTLDLLVSNLSDNLVLGDGLNLFGVFGVNIGDLLLTFLEDLFDVLSGIRDVIGIFDDFNGLLVSLFDDILDFFLLLLLGLLHAVILDLFVVFREGLEAVLDLGNHNVELLLGADVLDHLEGNA
jgi:hypothetical protein